MHLVGECPNMHCVFVIEKKKKSNWKANENDRDRERKWWAREQNVIILMKKVFIIQFFLLFGWNRDFYLCVCGRPDFSFISAYNSALFSSSLRTYNRQLSIKMRWKIPKILFFFFNIFASLTHLILDTIPNEIDDEFKFHRLFRGKKTMK